jgi:hypothetical protein
VSKKNKTNFDHPELKRRRKDLEGFEDVIDMIPGSRFNPDKKKNPRLNDDFEYLNLLENEVKRLGQLERFFFQKLRNEEKFDQTEKIIQNQRKHISQLREEILDQEMSLFNNVEKLMLTCFRAPEHLRKN